MVLCAINGKFIILQHLFYFIAHETTALLYFTGWLCLCGPVVCIWSVRASDCILSWSLMVRGPFWSGSAGEVVETRCWLSCVSTACAIGIIIAVVAVLLIHIDKNAVVDMNPSIRLWHVYIIDSVMSKSRHRSRDQFLMSRSWSRPRSSWSR